MKKFTVASICTLTNYIYNNLITLVHILQYVTCLFVFSPTLYNTWLFNSYRRSTKRPKVTDRSKVECYHRIGIWDQPFWNHVGFSNWLPKRLHADENWTTYKVDYVVYPKPPYRNSLIYHEFVLHQSLWEARFTCVCSRTLWHHLV